MLIPSDHETFAIWVGDGWSHGIRKLSSMSDMELLFWCKIKPPHSEYSSHAIHENRYGYGYSIVRKSDIYHGYPNAVVELRWYLENVHPQWWSKYKIVL